jgi:hypothetical protein
MKILDASVMHLTTLKIRDASKNNRASIAEGPDVGAWTDGQLRIFPGRKPTAAIILSID